MVARDDTGWLYLKGEDHNLPWKDGFTCKGCGNCTTKPIQVKHKIHTALYCPRCGEYIKNASKKELKNL